MNLKLGDIVTVHDKELNLLVKTRVVRRQYNLQELWNTVLELSTKLRELGDSQPNGIKQQRHSILY